MRISRETVEVLAGHIGSYAFIVMIFLIIGGGNPLVTGLALAITVACVVIMVILKAPGWWARATRPSPPRIKSNEDTP